MALALTPVALGLGGCGGGADSPEKHASNSALASAMALGSSEAEAELERRSEALEAAQDKAGHKGANAKIDRRIDHIDNLGWRAFDEQFRKTPFDRAIDGLPLRRGPLDVVQWVTDLPPDELRSKADRERFYGMSERARQAAVRAYYRHGSHELYARVDEKRFYRMSVHAREAAVKAFYRKARPLFEKEGIKNFVLVVTPWTETTEHLPALAVGRGGSVSITPLGRIVRGAGA